MALINQPPTTAVDESDSVNSQGAPATENVNQEWRNFFGSVYNICNAASMSGTTANRPLKLLWTGRPYFDTTLGLPIWYKTASWVKADGTAA